MVRQKIQLKQIIMMADPEHEPTTTLGFLVCDMAQEILAWRKRYEAEKWERNLEYLKEHANEQKI